LSRAATHSLASALAALLLGAAASAAAVEEPAPCVTRCREMAEKNQLRPGVSEAGCVTNLCQEEGKRLYAEGKYDAALKSFGSVSELLSRSPSFLLDRGLAYYAVGQFELALADFDGILASVPESFQASAQRANTLVRLKRLKEARAQFDKLMSTPAAQREYRGLRTSSYLQGNIGVMDLLLGDGSKGKKELEAALEADGRNSLASTYLYYVIPQLDAGTVDSDGVYLLLTASEDVGIARRDAARDSIEKLVSKYPKFPPTYFLADDLYRNTHHYEECERLLLIGEKALPKDVDLKANRLRCTLLKVGPTSAEAKAPIAELKKLSADNPEAELPKQILRALDIY
jgi:tetratricopeptide (TPR) repeat protein